MRHFERYDIQFQTEDPLKTKILTSNFKVKAKNYMYMFKLK